MAEKMLTITVNGEEVQAPSGQLVIHKLREMGIKVPTLCHDDRLTPYGGCRLCVVMRLDSRPGLIPACSTPVQQGMKLETDSEEVVASRRRQLQLLVLNHRMECPVCDRRGDCRLQDLIYEYGVPEDELPFELVRAPMDTGSPVIVRDPEKCVICGKCVRICDEVQGVAAIGLENRGLDAHVATFTREKLDCEFCGQCVNACPVAALVARPYTCDVPAWLRTSTKTTCSFCASGCQVQLETWDNRPQAAIPAIGEPPNSGKLCVKGWLGWDLLDSPGRLTKPLVRRDGSLEEASWDEALTMAAEALDAARSSNKATVGLGSSRLSVEDAYLMQRFMRGVVGTPHISPGPVGGVRALVDGALEATGVPSSSAGYREIAEAEFVFVLRADPARTHPLVKTELVQRRRQREMPFYTAHGLSGDLAANAEMHLHTVPGSEDALLHAISRKVLARSPERGKALASTEGFADWAESIGAYDDTVLASLTGVSPAVVDRLVERIIAAKSHVLVVVTGTGIPGDEAAVTRAAARLLGLLGAGEGGGLVVCGEKANLQGVIDVGLHPALLPGHRSVESAEGRAQVEEAFGASLPEEPGWRFGEFCERLRGQDVGLLYLAGQDPVSAWPHNCPGREAIEVVDTVIVQDAFLSATARLADIVLPVRILGERDGSVVSLDGQRRRLNRVFTPSGALPQDGDVFREISRRMGQPLPESADLEREIGRLVGWPVPASRETRFEAVAAPGESQAIDGVFLDASPQLFHSGTMTYRSPHLQQLAPPVAVRMNPDDAHRWGLRSGELVTLVASGKEVLLRARVDRNVREGSVIIPWGTDGPAIQLQSSEAPLAVEVRRPR